MSTHNNNFDANSTAGSICPLFDVNTRECAFYCSPSCKTPNAWAKMQMIGLIKIESWCLGPPSQWSDCGAYKNYQIGNR